eukprot:260777_1
MTDLTNPDADARITVLLLTLLQPWNSICGANESTSESLNCSLPQRGTGMNTPVTPSAIRSCTKPIDNNDLVTALKNPPTFEKGFRRDRNITNLPVTPSKNTQLPKGTPKRT